MMPPGHSASSDVKAMHATREAAAARQTQIGIVGGGLSGSIAAVVLGRAGYDVTLIDRSAVHPDEFRAEKIAGDQVGLMQSLGILASIAADSAPFAEVVNVRRGEVIDRSYNQHFGILYKDLVKAARAQLPAAVRFVVGRVIDVQTGPQRQFITLHDGTTIEARLVILATGMSKPLCGIGRRVVRPKQSMSFGFNVEPAPGDTFGFTSLTYYGEHGSDAIDYLSVFPIGGALRANLFTFHQLRDPWVRRLREDPKTALREALPHLGRFLGDFRVPNKVQSWVMDLSVADNHRRDGVAIIGDAFQTSCPAAGVGVSRLLTDVDRLCNVYIPQWLAAPGMGVDKIGQFYDDPIKRRTDMRAERLNAYRRSLSLDTSLIWKVHRSQVYLRRRALGWLRNLEARTPARPAEYMTIAHRCNDGRSTRRR